MNFCTWEKIKSYTMTRNSRNAIALTVSLRFMEAKAMTRNDQAIEVIKDEYCTDCMWKEEDPTHCDCCMVGDILNLLKGLDDESDE